jgi:uncharacterized repeat protein (TIGR01451 family)
VHLTSLTTPASCGTINNTAFATSSNDGSGNSSASITVNCAAIGVTKTADANTVSAGDTVGFTITVKNSGAGTAHNVVVTDTVPTTPGTSWSVNGGTAAGTCSLSAGLLTCTIGDLASQATATVHLTSLTTPASCGTINNTAFATSSNDGSGNSSASINVLCPSIGVTKTADVSTVNAGDQVGFTVTVTNTGAGTAHGVMVTDTLPSGIAWSIDSQPAGNPCSISAGLLTCNLGDLGPSTHAVIHITGTTSAANCGILTNRVVISATNQPPLTEGQTLSAEASITVLCPQTPPSITIVKTADDTPESRGDEVGFVVTVTNTGGGPAHNVVLTDPLPTGTDIHWSIAIPVAGCSISGNVLTCSRATLDAGASFAVHVTSPTSFSTECTTLRNTASVTSSDAGSASASASIVIKCADVEVRKSADDNPESAGDQVGFVIKVTNEGTDGAMNVSLTDPLPKGDGIDWSIATPVAGCFINNNLLTCHRRWMDPGESFTVHITSPTSIQKECGRTLENEASVTSANGGSDAASASIRIKCAAVEISKSVDADSVAAGGPIGFTIKVTNRGDDGAQNVSMTDPLPTGDGIAWSVANPVPGCSIDNNQLTCTRAWMDPGESFTVHATSLTPASVCKDYTSVASVQSLNGGKGSSGASVTALQCASAMAPAGPGTQVLGDRDSRSTGAAGDPGSTLASGSGPTPAYPVTDVFFGHLPVTGFDSGPIGLIALLFITVGAALTAIGRRRSAKRRESRAQ